MAAKHSKFVIKRSTRSHLFRFNLIGVNGEIVATSEAYTTKGKTKQGIRAVISAVHDLKPGSEISDEG